MDEVTRLTLTILLRQGHLAQLFLISMEVEMVHGGL